MESTQNDRPVTLEDFQQAFEVYWPGEVELILHPSNPTVHIGLQVVFRWGRLQVFLTEGLPRCHVSIDVGRKNFWAFHTTASTPQEAREAADAAFDWTEGVGAATIDEEVGRLDEQQALRDFAATLGEGVEVVEYDGNRGIQIRVEDALPYPRLVGNLYWLHGEMRCHVTSGYIPIQMLAALVRAARGVR